MDDIIGPASIVRVMNLPVADDHPNTYLLNRTMSCNMFRTLQVDKDQMNAQQSGLCLTLKVDQLTDRQWFLMSRICLTLEMPFVTLF